MTDKEFNLSEKEMVFCKCGNCQNNYFEVNDVKEFIKRLKEWTQELGTEIFDDKVNVISLKELNKVIDKLAGKKLTGKPVDLSGGIN